MPAVSAMLTVLCRPRTCMRVTNLCPVYCPFSSSSMLFGTPTNLGTTTLFKLFRASLNVPSRKSSSHRSSTLLIRRLEPLPSVKILTLLLTVCSEPSPFTVYFVLRSSLMGFPSLVTCPPRRSMLEKTAGRPYH